MIRPAPVARLKRRLHAAQTSEEIREILQGLGLSRQEAIAVYEKIFYLGKQHERRALKEAAAGTQRSRDVVACAGKIR